MMHLDFALIASLVLLTLFAIATRLHVTPRNLMILGIGLGVIFLIATNYEAFAHVTLNF